MQVINLDAQRLKMLAPQPPLVLALGFFDGVHQGHQRVIQTVKRIAKQRGLPLAVMTFNRHASQLFQPQANFRYLNTVAQKSSTWTHSRWTDCILRTLTTNLLD